MKLLWLGHNLAYPPKGGALQRNYNLLQEASRKCEVHVLAFDQPTTRPVNVTPQDCVHALSDFCASVDWAPLDLPFLRANRYACVLKGLMEGQPYDFSWLHSNAMAEKVKRAVKFLCPDVVHVDTLGLAQYLPLLGEVASVLNHHDIESSRAELRRGKERNPLLSSYLSFEARRLRSAEKYWCPQFNLNVVVSSEEERLILRACPGLVVRVVPNGVDTRYFSPRSDPQTKTVLFCGSMDMYPNQEGVKYFLKRVWPAIVAAAPKTQLQIVGRRPPQWLLRLGDKDPRIRVTGYVDDVREYFRSAAIFVCPILSGGGTRLKILDSMAMGVPVVSTSFAASGLDLEDTKHLLLADTAELFAERTLRLLADCSLRERLASAAVQHVRQLFSWAEAGQALHDAYEYCLRKWDVAHA